jgi:hypothetical protein
MILSVCAPEMDTGQLKMCKIKITFFRGQKKKLSAHSIKRNIPKLAIELSKKRKTTASFVVMSE